MYERRMNFRSVNDLFAAVRRNGHRIPPDVELVVGIPRSGVLAACAVSLITHKPYADLSAFLDGRIDTSFSKRRGVEERQPLWSPTSVLVVDDSVFSGQRLRQVREVIEGKGLKKNVRYAAVFGLESSHSEADLVLEECPYPRLFEWNVMNHPSLNACCVDLDGVLCADPSEEENDDGSRYIEFLQSARLLNAPRYTINSVVTSRLEKYRPQTEEWLKEQGINYGRLVMLDLPSGEERRRLGIHGQFKAEIFRQAKDCILFIESETHQARTIREISGKNVLAYKEMLFFPEGGATVRRARQIAKRFLPQKVVKIVQRAIKR
jgi:uncharacterized HAD superfamily protein/orotate phosphoribosyltransferase